MSSTVRSLLVFLVTAMFGLSVFGGCGAIHREMTHGKLKTHTKMSETIFLDPMGPDKKVVWVDVKNTSDKELGLQDVLKTALTAKGYRIIDDPDEAHYQIQVNIQYVGELDETAAHQSLYAGYGGPVLGLGAGLGAGVAARSSRRVKAAAGLGGLLVGAIAEGIGDAMNRIITYSVITDIQVSQRSLTPVLENQHARLIQGRGSVAFQQSSGTNYWKRYRARVISTATQTNLKFEEAQYDLTTGLIRSVSGIL